MKTLAFLMLSLAFVVPAFSGEQKPMTKEEIKAKMIADLKSSIAFQEKLLLPGGGYDQEIASRKVAFEQGISSKAEWQQAEDDKVRAIESLEIRKVKLGILLGTISRSVYERRIKEFDEVLVKLQEDLSNKKKTWEAYKAFSDKEGSPAFAKDDTAKALKVMEDAQDKLTKAEAGMAKAQKDMDALGGIEKSLEF
jgi:hypothetical protein